MKHREEVKAATREKILTATRALVGKHGFVQVTTADVAKAAGISHGAVFVHFPTRDALIDAVVEAFGSSMGKRLHTLSRQGADLRTLLTAHLEAIGTDEAFYTALVRERTLLPESAKDTFIAMQTMASHHFEGAFAASTNNEAHALYFNTWLGLIHHYLAQRDLFTQPGESVIARHGETLVHHFINLTHKD